MKINKSCLYNMIYDREKLLTFNIKRLKKSLVKSVNSHNLCPKLYHQYKKCLKFLKIDSDILILEFPFVKA